MSGGMKRPMSAVQGDAVNGTGQGTSGSHEWQR